MGVGGSAILYGYVSLLTWFTRLVSHLVANLSSQGQSTYWENCIILKAAQIFWGVTPHVRIK